VWASGVQSDFEENSTLSCGSDAYPPAQYQWNVFAGSGVADGSLFAIDSHGFFNISCAAFNFPRSPDDDQCTGATLYMTGYAPLSQCTCFCIPLYAV